MSPRELLRRFPNASKATLKANCGTVDLENNRQITRPVVESADQIQAPVERSTGPGIHAPEHSPLQLEAVYIYGQIRGGKNNMIVTKRGKHIPKKEWAKWRDLAVQCVQEQLPKDWNPIDRPTKVRIKYVAGDLKRRDFPAICDSIWHVLERAGVVTDDTFLWPAESTREYDKQNPRAIITFL